jgi:hypothetical protein
MNSFISKIFSLAFFRSVVITHLILLSACAGCNGLRTTEDGGTTPKSIAAMPPVRAQGLVENKGGLQLVSSIPSKVHSGECFDVKVVIANCGTDPEWFNTGSDVKYYIRRQGQKDWCTLSGEQIADPFGPTVLVLEPNVIVNLVKGECQLSVSHLKLGLVSPGIYDLAILKRSTSCGDIKSFRQLNVI